MVNEPITKQNFWTQAQAFIAALPKDKRANLPTIKRGSGNLSSWLEYFDRHLGWRPSCLQRCLDHAEHAMTVPAEWPMWFDSSFAENPLWRPRMRSRTQDDPEARQRVAEALRRLGASLTLPAKQRPRRDEYKPLGDDDLRALYPAPSHQADAARAALHNQR